MELTLSTVATLEHVNVRQEGPKEAKALALDLKLSAVVSADIVDTLLCIDNEGECIEAFWLANEDGAPRFPKLAGTKIETKVPEVELTTLGLHLPHCALGGFRFSPMSGRLAALTFSCSIHHPPANALPILADFLTQDIEIELATTQLGLLEQQDSARPVLRRDKFDQALEDLIASRVQQLASNVPEPNGDQPDGLLDAARVFVIETRRASISAIQRLLKIGYNRAARLIEALEAEGVVTPMNSNGGRDVIAPAPITG